MDDIDLEGFERVVPLGSGGLGDVYRATRRSTGGEVAIKVLRDWSDHDVAWQRTQRELRALVDLRGHANVVNVEEVIETDGAMAIVMEYAPGGSVVDLLRARHGRLELPEALLVGEHTAAALASAHDRGIIHRDIKPHNLLIGAFGQVKVCDFGIASLTRSESVRDRTASLSLRYASPEELRGEHDVGPAADVYSLGATIHQLLTGQYLPPPDGTAGSLPLRTWIAPDDVPADVELDVRSLIVRATDRRPENRPTAAELRDRFESLSGRLGSQRVRALPLVTPGLDDASGRADGSVSPVVAAAAAALASTDAAGSASTDVGGPPPTDARPPGGEPTLVSPPGPVGDAGAATAVMAGSAAGSTPPPGPPPGSVPPAPPGGDDPGSSGRTAVIAFVAMAVLLGGAVAAFAFGWIGGDDDTAAADESTTTEATTTPETTVAPVTVAVTSTPETTTTEAPTTTAAPTTSTEVTTTTTTLPERYDGRKCPGVGDCIEMSSILLADGEYVIRWNASFTPSVGGTHAHFFWDVHDADQVGSASADRAPWELTADQPFVPSGELSVANRPDAAAGICVTAADAAHAVIDPAFYHCALVPVVDPDATGVVELWPDGPDS